MEQLIKVLERYGDKPLTAAPLRSILIDVQLTEATAKAKDAEERTELFWKLKIQERNGTT